MAAAIKGRATASQVGACLVDPELTNVPPRCRGPAPPTIGAASGVAAGVRSAAPPAGALCGAAAALRLEPESEAALWRRAQAESVYASSRVPVGQAALRGHALPPALANGSQAFGVPPASGMTARELERSAEAKRLLFPPTPGEGDGGAAGLTEQQQQQPAAHTQPGYQKGRLDDGQWGATAAPGGRGAVFGRPPATGGGSAADAFTPASPPTPEPAAGAAAARAAAAAAARAAPGVGLASHIASGAAFGAPTRADGQTAAALLRGGRDGPRLAPVATAAAAQSSASTAAAPGSPVRGSPPRPRASGVAPHVALFGHQEPLPPTPRACALRAGADALAAVPAAGGAARRTSAAAAAAAADGAAGIAALLAPTAEAAFAHAPPMSRTDMAHFFSSLALRFGPEGSPTAFDALFDRAAQADRLGGAAAKLATVHRLRREAGL